MNIGKMKAGPRLDALIAERIMGWKCIGTRQSRGMAVPLRYKRQWRTPEGWITFELPRFSEKMDLAWAVAEKLMKDCIVRISNGDGDSCDCTILPFNVDKYNLACARAETFPLAICRVSLEALQE